MNIVDLVLFQCRLQPPAPAMCVPGPGIGLISYGRLERAIYNIARRAREAGLTRGQRVALAIDDPLLHSAFILGLTYVGVITLSVRSAELPRHLNIDAVIGTLPRPLKYGRRFILVDSTWLEGDGAPVDLSPAERGGGADTCRIALTSGTTGDAKACGFSHDLLARRIARYTWLYGNRFPECSRIFIDPGLVTALGHHFWLYGLVRGGTVFFRGADPVETFQALGLYKVQAMIAAPAALAEFVELYEQAPAFSSSLDVIWTGGSLMSRALSERVRARLCSNLICNYGSTETNTIASAPAHAVAHVPGAVGYLAPDVAVEVTDAAGNRLSPGDEGLLRIRAEVASNSYLDDPEETGRVFRSGWFHSGDFARVMSDGLLVISGREKSVLNLGGDKVSPERIEEVLASAPGVVRAAAFTVANAMGIEELFAAVVSPSFNDRALRAHCERHLAHEQVPRRFVAVSDIPLNEMGKIDRRQLRTLLSGD